MSADAAAKSRFWSAGLVLLAVYLVGFALIRISCETMLSGNGIHMLALPKPLHHSASDWDRPFARVLVAAYQPLFWADVKLTKRMYFRDEAGTDVVVPWVP